MSAQHSPATGVEVSLRIGQHVRHRDFKGQRVTGVVHGIALDSDKSLMVDLVLDAPIVIPASEEIPTLYINRQYVPAHEVTSFDERDELIAEMLAALQGVVRVADRATDEFDAARAAISKATGSAT